MNLSKIFVLAILTVTVIILREEPKEYFDFDSYDLAGIFKETIPETHSVEQANYPEKWSNIFNSDGETVGKFLLSSPYCDDITGYGGNLSLALVADNDESITAVKILSHRETPSWINGLKNVDFFSSWNDKRISDIKEHRIDAVSGATYTSAAVIGIIQKRADIFTGETEHVITASKPEFKWLDGKSSVVLYFILFISLIALFVKKINKYRIHIQTLSIIFFGLISGKFISLYLLESISISGISVLTTWTVVLLLILSVIIPLVLNKHFYCYYICPFGGVQSLLGKIPVRKIKPHVSVLKFMRILRLLIFFSLLTASVASLGINLTLVEPFTVFIFSSAAAVTVAASLVIFILSVFIKMPWCVYLCPTGQFFDLLKDGLPFRVKKNKNSPDAKNK